MRWRRPPKPSPTWHDLWNEPFRPVFDDEATVDVVVPLELRGGDDQPIRSGRGPQPAADEAER